MRPYKTVAKYVNYVQQGRYDDVVLLWAEDAIFCDAHGNVRRGRSEIKQFYSDINEGITPPMRISRYIEDQPALTCVFELETRMSRDGTSQWKCDPDGEFMRSAVEWMTVNEDGKIQTMFTYAAPPSHWAAISQDE